MLIVFLYCALYKVQSVRKKLHNFVAHHLELLLVLLANIS